MTERSLSNQVNIITRFAADNKKAARRRLFRGTPQLTLGELLAATRLAQADFLPLHFPCIAGHQTSLAQGALQSIVVIDQGAGNAMTHRTRLTGLAATGNVDHNVKAGLVVGNLQSLTHDHAPGFTGKILIDGLAINNNGSLAGLQKYPGNGALAPTR